MYQGRVPSIFFVNVIGTASLDGELNFISEFTYTAYHLAWYICIQHAMSWEADKQRRLYFCFKYWLQN